MMLSGLLVHLSGAWQDASRDDKRSVCETQITKSRTSPMHIGTDSRREIHLAALTSGKRMEGRRSWVLSFGASDEMFPMSTLTSFGTCSVDTEMSARETPKMR